MPFLDFTAGDVLTAANVDTMFRQGVMTFASASARDTALTGVLDEGMHAYLEDIDALTYYTGSAWKYLFTQWTSFTPGWINITTGNGTNSGEYRYVGGDLQVRAELTLGSTSSVTGAVSLTLPNSETTRATGPVTVGSAMFVDAGTAVLPGTSSLSTSDTTIGFFADNTVTSTAPFTWTTNDVIRCNITAPL